MNFRLLQICSFFVFALGNGISKNVSPLSVNTKFFLKYKDKFCLYPENVIDSNMFEIASEECDKIAHEDEGKIVWLYFNDDRIRTHNGLCLKTFKNFLVVSPCSPNPNDISEKWKIDDEQHLKNGKDQCAQMAGNKLFSFNCNKLSTTEFELKQFSEAEMNLMKTRYAQKQLQNINQEQIHSLHQKYKTAISSFNDIEKETERMTLNEIEIEKEKKNIYNFMNEIKLLLNNSSALSEYGTGALMVVYDSINIENKKSVLKVPLNKLEINESILKELGSEQGEIKIIIASFLNVPEENDYTFVAKNIKGNLLIKLGNHEIISNHNVSIDSEITSPLIHLPYKILIPITIELYATDGKPSFTLYWSNNNLAEQIITSMYLYTTVFEKVCYPPMLKKIECSTTFETVQKSFFFKENQELHLLCPSECLKLEKFPIYQKKDVLSPWANGCYSLNSSICGSAVESDFISNTFGGSINVLIQDVKNINGEIEKCGFITPNDLNENTIQGITDIKLIDNDDFFRSYITNKDIYEGYKGIVTDDIHSLLSKTDLSKNYIVDIDLHCKRGPINAQKEIEQEKEKQSDSNPKQYTKEEDTNTDDELTGGSFVVRRRKPADLMYRNDAIVVDVFALFEKYDEKKVDINISGWTRKSCNNIQLFLKYKKKKELLTYPSLLLSCSDTFENVSFENSATINARCLPFCKTDKPVVGSYIYSPRSPICKSAVHSGVITNYGGIIEITKIENLTQHFLNAETNTITRNNVTAILNSAEKNTESYYISKPGGIICNYPRNSFDINESLNLGETWESDEDQTKENEQEERTNAKKGILYSFLQMETPPVSLVTVKHAMLQNQLHKLHHVYSKDEYKQRYFPGSISTEYAPKGTRYLKTENISRNMPDVNSSTGNTNSNIITKNTEAETAIKTELLKLKEVFQKNRQNIHNLSVANQGIFSSLLKKNTSLNSLSNKLTKIRMAQKIHEDFLKNYEASIISLIKQFTIVTGKKKKRIVELERALKNIQPMKIETFKETYDSRSVNNNYTLIDAVHNINGPSNWKIEKYTKGNFVSAITDDSSIKSNDFVYGTYLIKKQIKLCKGFISADIKLPYMGSIGIIYRYKDHKNFSNFIISRTEYYFLEVKNGFIGKKINRKELDTETELGNWTKIFLDFGYTHSRIYLNEKYTTGYKAENADCGFLGFGINGASEKVFFDKIIIGSLDQAKYYMRTISDIASFDEREQREKRRGVFQTLETHTEGAMKPKRGIEKMRAIQETGEIKQMHHIEGMETEKAQEKEIEAKKENLLWGRNKSIQCNPFEENFTYPLEVNWIIQVKSTWKVTNKFHINSVFSKNKPENAYLISTQNWKGDTATPSIILLKTQNVCSDFKSYLFETLLNVENASKAGIIFKILSADNFFSVIVDVANPLGKIYLLKVVEGVPYQLIAPTHIPIKKNTWYHLKMTHDGTHIHVTLNDEKVFDANLNELSSPSLQSPPISHGLGAVGLIVLSGKGKFKNIRFTPNPI